MPHASMLLLLILIATATAYTVHPRWEVLQCYKSRKVSPGYCTTDKDKLPRGVQARKGANDASCADACAKDAYCEYYSVGKGSYAGSCVLFGKNMQRNVASKMSNCYGGDPGNPNSKGTYATTWTGCFKVVCEDYTGKNQVQTIRAYSC